MSRCAFELLSLIPVPFLRLRLGQWHVGRCPLCRRESDRAEDLPQLLVTADRIPAGLDLRSGVLRGIAGLTASMEAPAASTVPGGRSWRWAYAAATLVLAVIAGFWAVFLGKGMKPHPRLVEPPARARVCLCSAKIANRPARVFQVQSRDPDRAIFWIAKDSSRS